jgi:hypothetical protein
MLNLGDFRPGQTLYVPFHTFNAAGGSVTITGLAVTDIEIYKAGSTTQRSSDAGYALLDTDGIDFDGLTGIHGFSVDLSDNTDSGFYAAGNDYWIVVSAITVDSQTVSFIAATFSIENRSALMPTTSGRRLDVTPNGEAGIDLGNVGNPTTTLNLSGTTIKAVTDAGADTAGTTTLLSRVTEAPLAADDYEAPNNSAILAIAEAIDELLDDACPEVDSIPAAGDLTVRQALAILAMLALSPNTATASARVLKKRDGTTVGTATRSDNGTTYDQGALA